MTTPFLLFTLAFLGGYMIAPVYFVLHRTLKMKSKTLEEELLHLHHSFYGLVLALFGLILGLTATPFGYYLIAIGLGLIVHHEKTEKGLVGIQKFIYIRKFHGRR